MVTTSHAKLLDRKEKARKASLQWLFSESANDVRVPRISDKRDAGVSSTNLTSTNPGGLQDRNKGDSLPGFLTLDLFTGGLLSLAFHGVSIVSIAENADEIWLDWQKPAAASYPEATYFPY